MAFSPHGVFPEVPIPGRETLRRPAPTVGPDPTHPPLPLPLSGYKLGAQ